MKTPAILMAVFGIACGAAPQVPTFCDTHRCNQEETTFAPVDARAAAVLAPELERWSKATGRDLTVAAGGVPVVWAEDLRAPCSDDPSRECIDCAKTVVSGFRGGPLWTQRIELDPTPPGGCPAPEVSLLHELIHAMAPTAEHVRGDSLFATSTGVNPRPIDSAALSRLCETFDCAFFRPEM